MSGSSSAGYAGRTAMCSGLLSSWPPHPQPRDPTTTAYVTEGAKFTQEDGRKRGTAAALQMS